MVKEFAEYLSLTIWDWLAVSIALFSLFVAVLSFIIAKRTLASQRQTEKNTMPIINITIQEFLFSQLVIKLLDAYIKLTALWNIVAEKEFIYYPSEHILSKLKIDNSFIHPELFYNDPDSYKIIEGFISMINEYNINIDVLNDHLKCENIRNEMISNEFYSVISANNRLADNWGKIMSILFKYDHIKLSELLNPFISSPNENKLDELNLKYFKPDNEIYLTFLQSDSQKASLMMFMDSETDEHIKEYSNFLINKFK